MQHDKSRRNFARGAGLLGAALTIPGASVLAQSKKPDIVIGASIPLSGIFASTAASYHTAMQDYVNIANEQGGIDGRMLRYVAEDTGYKVDVSVAAFNKITARETVNFYYADSTAFAKTIGPEVARHGQMLMSGNSFGSELNDPAKFPFYFMPGPDYSEMIGMLLRYIAQEAPKSKVALIHSDSEFGRDPVGAARKTAADLGLDLTLMATPPGAVDVSAEVLKLRRVNPDYTIFHGYTLAPIPDFITQASGLKMKTRFMGTVWSMDLSILEKMGPAADGFLGVNPYRYHFEKAERAPMLDKIRAIRPEYQQNGYMLGFLTAMLFAESARRTLAAGKPMTGPNLKAALNSIKDFDTGGIIGVPITIPGNSVPYGRVYRFDAKAKTVLPVSDWLKIGR